MGAEAQERRRLISAERGDRLEGEAAAAGHGDDQPSQGPFMRSHLGSYEGKLCLTLHNNEGNYLTHTEGKHHQTNLTKCATREAKEAPAWPQQ